MIRYVYDDGGRAASGRRGSARDCVCRALAILTSRPYEECYQALAEANARHGKGARSARNGVHTKAWPKVFAEFGLVKVQLPGGPRPTWTEAWARYGNCIVRITRPDHTAALVAGALRDTVDRREYLFTEYKNPLVEVRQRKAVQVWLARP